MYSILRFCIIIILCLIAIVIARRLKARKAKVIIFFVFVVSFILYSLLLYVPIENYLITFEKPESVYNYTHMNSADVVIEGFNSALLLNIKNNGNSDLYFVSRTTNGWKIEPNNIYHPVIYQNIIDGFPIYVYTHKGSKDCYISIQSLNGEIDIEKDNNSELINLKQINSVGDNWFTYYAYIGTDIDSYSFRIDGKEYTISW